MTNKQKELENEYWKITDLKKLLTFRIKEDEQETVTENFNNQIKSKIRLMEEAQEFGSLIEREEIKKKIEDFEKLRLYRSKSCQLLLRRLKQELLNSLGDKNVNKTRC